VTAAAASIRNFCVMILLHDFAYVISPCVSFILLG
jgi:hypothetical protein